MSNPATEPSYAPPSASPSELRFAFDGSGTSFFLIFLKNILLTTLTFGIYLAWAKTERRKYVWNNLSLNDEHFRYTGTGMELFKGYLVVAGGYLTFVVISAIAGQVSPGAETAVETAMAFGVLLIIPILIYRSRAFLYNRTELRSIRFGLLPKSSEYARTFYLGFVLTIITLGAYGPIMTNRLHRVITDNTRFGSLAFSYSGKDGDAFRIATKGMLLSIVTLGIYAFWWSAEVKRYQAKHTQIGATARLQSDISGGELFVIFLLGTFGTALTLGLAFPWITMYSMRIMAERTCVVGAIDFDSVEQLSKEAGATADGLVDVLDIDVGM